ncbi:aspartyl protease family protein [Flavobacterium sp.]|uniref:aspartyl protease family protein n=1 Tax=Flavobacterium sp. TaxID=239 RepID=UPI003BED0E07
MKKEYFVSIFIMLTLIMKGQTRITMLKDGGVYSVPCKVNGLPLKFIFDTGASDVSISLTEASFMLKNGYLNKEDIGENVYYSIAN